MMLNEREWDEHDLHKIRTLLAPFVEDIRREERERCAKVVLRYDGLPSDTSIKSRAALLSHQMKVADLIRAGS